MNEQKYMLHAGFGRKRKVVSMSKVVQDGQRLYRFVLECGHESSAASTVDLRMPLHCVCPFCAGEELNGRG